MSSPAESFRDKVVALGAGNDYTNSVWPTFVSYMPDTPDECIVCYDAAGRSPNPQFAVDYPSVKVLVRGKVGGYSDAYTKCVAVKNAMLGLPSQDINASWRWVSVAMSGDINSLGVDENKRPIFSMNYDIIAEPVASGNREAI